MREVPERKAGDRVRIMQTKSIEELEMKRGITLANRRGIITREWYQLDSFGNKQYVVRIDNGPVEILSGAQLMGD